jgi:hypothetical protein
VAASSFYTKGRNMNIRKGALCLLAVAGLACRSEAQCGTRNARAFLEVRYPGTIPVDENRQPLHRGPDSTYTIYVESANRQLGAGYAWVDKKTFRISTEEVTVAEIGREKQSGEAVIMKPAKGYRLWRISLYPVAARKMPLKQVKGTIQLQFNNGGKTCTQTIRRITELKVIPSV